MMLIKKSKFESNAEECWLKINNKAVLYGTRNKSGGLYKVHMEVLIPNNLVEVNIANTNYSILQLYHERWGHQDKRHIKNVLEQQMDLKVELDNQLYVACIYGKAHRLKFVSRQKAKQFGKLISADLELISRSMYMNRTGTSSLPNVNPYELWMVKKPRIGHMRIVELFGYAHITNKKRRKMDKKALKGYILEYDGKPLKNCEVAVEIPLPEANRQLPEAENEGQNDPEDSESEDEEKSNIMKLRNRSELKKPKSLKIK
ncbi:hypothetical protein AVEN_246086-1 [Araneus ventricosus]|uniref:GAG-pre-integrase domain-containing protein n=1 Tax=Araneus ventricosus TaxID=182803 RepID=A0A4Y2UH82_ARAVE|nr:hypothetical protein AVEN_246086-1 [Araneus ventricosus]